MCVVTKKNGSDIEVRVSGPETPGISISLDSNPLGKELGQAVSEQQAALLQQTFERVRVRKIIKKTKSSHTGSNKRELNVYEIVHVEKFAKFSQQKLGIFLSLKNFEI